MKHQDTVEVYKLKIQFHTAKPNALVMRDEFGVWTLDGEDYSHRGSIFEGEIALTLDEMRKMESLMEIIIT